MATSWRTSISCYSPPSTTNPTGEPVTCGRVTLPQYWFTTNNQPPPTNNHQHFL
ncbi:MAG: hypothetical protein ACHBN1_38280 [Heteroscytonema crispum UTEX LB 1556]